MSVSVRDTETRPVAAAFCPAKNQSVARESVSQKFGADQEICEADEGLFRAEIEFGDAPRYDQKDDPDGARRLRNYPMLQK